MQSWPQLKIVNYCCFVFKDNECCLWCFYRCLRCLPKGKFRSGSNYKFAYIREILGTFVLNANVYVPYHNISSFIPEVIKDMDSTLLQSFGVCCQNLFWFQNNSFILLRKAIYMISAVWNTALIYMLNILLFMCCYYSAFKIIKMFLC